MSRDICIYHANCADGFTAAWCVRWALGAQVDFIPASYGSEPPDVTGADVVIVDFSYPRATLEAMAETANSVLVLDHHKTAEADLAGLPAPGRDRWGAPHGLAVEFDMDRSGAQMAWDHFIPLPRPALVDYVADRDLWRWQLPNSREVNAVIGSYDFAFDRWDDLATKLEIRGMIGSTIAAEGAALLRQQDRFIVAATDASLRYMVIGGHRVPVANVPPFMASDAAGALAEGNPFAATYYDGPKGRAFSLRSRGPDGQDVSEIARRYGGGGHRNAAGFLAARGWEGEE